MVSQDKTNTHHLDNTVMRRSQKYRQVPPKNATLFNKEPLIWVILSGLLRDYRKATCSTLTTHLKLK